MIKNKIFRYLFKSEIDGYNNVITRNRNECELKIKKMEAEVEKIKKQYALAHRIFYLFPTAKIVAIEENKSGEELFVVEKVDSSSLTIYLFGVSYQGITHLPRIESTIIKRDFSKENYIHIEDIQMQDNEIGNGSIAMKYFLKAAETLKVDYIDGWLSSVDANHFERSENYYAKFGFEVKFNESRTNGGIKLLMGRGV